ncbi:hypothetical protein D3C71_2018090 [compost metagenome]
MPLQRQTIFIAGLRQLALQRTGINANPHRRKLEGILQYRVPDQNIAVQTCQAFCRRCRPVIIIRRTDIV